MYDSDTVTGSDSVTVTVSKAQQKALPQVVRSVEKTDTGFSVDLNDIIPDDIGAIDSYVINGEVRTTGSVTVGDPAVSGGVVTAQFSGGAKGDTITVPVRINAANYDCTVDVTIDLVYNPVLRTVTIADCSGGTVTADRLSGYEGESVLLNVNPDYGSYFDSLTVTDADVHELDVTDGRFIMPDTNVTVTASFTTRFTYDWRTHALTLVSGDYDNTEDWDGILHHSDPASVTAMNGVRFVGDCSNMFRYFDNCESIDLSKVDVSGVTDMSDMFYGCEQLQTLDLGGWDASQTASMFEMFAYCESLKELNLSGLVTSSVTDLRYMFCGCHALETLNISGWDTSSVTDMRNLFDNCHSLQSIDLSGFDTSSLTYLDELFNACESLTSIDLTGFDASGAESLSRLFTGCKSLETVTLPGLVTSNIEYIDCMFMGCSSLTSINMSGWDTSGVMDMTDMFKECESLTTIDLSGFNTSNLFGTNGMFSGCTSLESVDLNGWEGESIYDMTDMFRNCTSLTGMDLSALNAPYAENLSGMFSGCTNLESVQLPALGDNLSNISELFSFCTSLTTMDISGLSTENMQVASAVFAGCTSLESASLPTFSAMLIDASNLFSGCTSLTSATVSCDETYDTVSVFEMFDDCSSLVSVDLSGFNAKCSDLYLMFCGCSALTTADISGIEIVSGSEDDLGACGMFYDCGGLRSLTVSSGTAITEDMDLNNGNPAEIGWVVEGDDTLSVISDDGDFAVINAPAAVTAYVWKNGDLWEFSGHSLSLVGDIGVNFYMDLTDEQAADNSVRFLWTVNDEQKSSVSTVTKDEMTGLYKATCHIAPAELTCDITAIITINDVDYTDRYSAVTYADVILNDADFAASYIQAENDKGNNGETCLAQLRTTVTDLLNNGAAAIPDVDESSYIRGDADGDGEVNIIDATTIQKVIAGLETDRDGWIKRRGNVTGGGLDITDATAVQRYLAKLNDPYKIGATVTYDEYELPFIPN